jgi:hypothetical protein
MKKTLIFFILIVFETNIFGQTDSLEKAILYNRLTTKELNDLEFSNTWKQWNQKIKANEYPDQPIDQEGQVHYTFINEFKGSDKEYLFNRTLEWLAIYYDLLPVNVYTNIKDGKIIYTSNLNLFDSYSCTPTAIITIKDEKIKYEMINISFQAFFYGDYETGIPDRTIDLNVYPVVLKKQSEWDLSLSLLRETKRLFKSETDKLNDYIMTYEYSNEF